MNADPPVPFGWARAAKAGLTFRPIADADLPFLAKVFASTRVEELAATSMTDAQKAAFLNSQFQAQHAHFQRHYSQAYWLVVMSSGNDIGRLYIERGPIYHAIIDIALLPECRGRGGGETLLRDVMDDAAAAGKGVSTYVEKHNPAMRLYQRLGFKSEEDNGVYDLMCWKPAVS